MEIDLLIRFGIFLVVLSLMLIWELKSPFRHFVQSKIRRNAINLALMGVNFGVLRLLSGGGAIFSAEYAMAHDLGIFNQVSVPQWFSASICLLTLDFAIYCQHIVFHKVPILWRLHKVHHCDLGFDSTTGVRFHAIEILLSMYFKMVLVLLLGASSLVVLIFEVVLNACAIFNHGNVQIPQPWDGRLRRVLITPDMHRIHHSTNPLETNSNYGFSVSWWDRICGTYRELPELGQNEMEIGTKQERLPENLGFTRLLALPFLPVNR